MVGNAIEDMCAGAAAGEELPEGVPSDSTELHSQLWQVLHAAPAQVSKLLHGARQGRPSGLRAMRHE